MGVTRQRLRDLIGLAEPVVALVSRREEVLNGYVVEHLVLRLGDVDVRGILTRPEDNGRRWPAMLYGHSHGGRYDIGASELLDGREYLLDPLGPVFARAGYVTLCIDMPVFGERADVSESFAAKALLWQGKS